MVVASTLAKIKTTIDNTITKLNELNLFGRQLEADVTTFKNNLPLLEKIKIPHEKNISNMVYTTLSGVFDWAPKINTLTMTASVKGIYRLTIVSLKQFNISS